MRPLLPAAGIARRSSPRLVDRFAVTPTVDRFAVTLTVDSCMVTLIKVQIEHIALTEYLPNLPAWATLFCGSFPSELDKDYE